MRRCLFVCFSFSISRSSKINATTKPADACLSAAPAKRCQLQGCCREPAVEQAQQNSASPGTAGLSCDPALRSTQRQLCNSLWAARTHASRRWHKVAANVDLLLSRPVLLRYKEIVGHLFSLWLHNCKIIECCFRAVYP